jgi:serine/threonine protein phosphatase 1
MLIIGDIHGCYDELQELLDAAGIANDELVVSVGDLVDRGPDPARVLDFFRTRAASVALCGNHERKHVRGVCSYSQDVTRHQLAGRYADDVAWMRTLPYHFETLNVRVVHFGHYPGVPLDEVPEDVRAGSTSGEAKLRERFGDAPWWEHYSDEVPIAFGHHVTGDEPLIVRDRIYGLDTGACHGGRLTGLVLPARRIISVPARRDYWAEVRVHWQAAVLREQPWATMTFEQIDKKLRSLRDPELGDQVLDRVAAWTATLRTALPELRERLDGEVARLVAEVGDDEFGRAAAAHPAGSWLLRRRKGKLSTTHLGCPRPTDVLQLGAALGVTLPPKWT